MVKGNNENFGFKIDGTENLDAARISCKSNSQDTNYLFQKSLDDITPLSARNLYSVRITALPVFPKNTMRQKAATQQFYKKRCTKPNNQQKSLFHC